MSINPLHFFGICFPHKWGSWMVWDMYQQRWVPAKPYGPGVRVCQHCNERQERK